MVKICLVTLYEKTILPISSEIVTILMPTLPKGQAKASIASHFVNAINDVEKKGCKAFGQLEFRHRAFSAYGILSVGILAYGILSILLLVYSILAMHLVWHIQIIITAWTFFHLQCPSVYVYNIPI